MDTRISPSYLATKLDNPTHEDLVDVLEDRVRFWLLEPAKALAPHPIGQVAGFNLLMGYFEGIWIYIQGQDSLNRSRVFFRDAFVDVFKSCGLSPETLGRIAEVFYKDARCGFFHDGLFRGRIYFGKVNGGCINITWPLKDGVVDQAGEIQTILVDVEGFFRYVEGHFKRLLLSLRASGDGDLQTRFKKICREKWDYDSPGRHMVLM